MASRLQSRILAQRVLLQRLSPAKKRGSLQMGFTLIELLVVVVIIGILSAIAVPSFLNQRQKAYNASGQAWASGEARKCAASNAIGSDGGYTYLAAAGDSLKASPAPASNPDPAVCNGATATFSGGGKSFVVDSAGGVTVTGS